MRRMIGYLFLGLILAIACKGSQYDWITRSSTNIYFIQNGNDTENITCPFSCDNCSSVFAWKNQTYTKLETMNTTEINNAISGNITQYNRTLNFWWLQRNGSVNYLIPNNSKNFIVAPKGLVPGGNAFNDLGCWKFGDIASPSASTCVHNIDDVLADDLFTIRGNILHNYSRENASGLATLDSKNITGLVSENVLAVRRNNLTEGLVFNYDKQTQFYYGEKSRSLEKVRFLTAQQPFTTIDIYNYTINFSRTYRPPQAEKVKVLCTCVCPFDLNELWEHFGGMVTCDAEEITNMTFVGHCRATEAYDGVTLVQMCGGSAPLYNWIAIESEGYKFNNGTDITTIYDQI